VVVGFDIGTFEILALPRWGTADFGRPWRVHNPEQLPDLVRLLVQLAQGRRLRVAPYVQIPHLLFLESATKSAVEVSLAYHQPSAAMKEACTSSALTLLP